MPVSQEQYDALLNNMKWVHAIASIIVEEQGGLVKINKNVLASYDLRGELRVTDKDDHYEIQVIPPVVDGESE